MREFAFTVSVVTSVRVLADNAHDAREALDAAIGTLSTGHVKIADEVDHSLHENAVIKDIMLRRRKRTG